MALSPNFAGTWNIDPSHSQLGFMVRHAMVTKTRGQFTDYAGSFTIDPENVNNAANVVIQASLQCSLLIRQLAAGRDPCNRARVPRKR